MNEETTKALTNLAKMFGSDRVLTSQEIDKVLNSILKMLVENKKSTDTLNADTKSQVEKLLNKFLDKYQVFTEDMKTLKEDVSDVEKSMLKKVETKIEEITYLVDEIKKINTTQEKLEIDDVVQAVLENITLPEVQQMMEISGERIIDLINETANTDENKISWNKIKDIPDYFSAPSDKKSKLGKGGMSPTVLRQAVDLDHSTRADGYAIVWDETLQKHKYAASGGGGGGSGTVNSGTQYRLAYYATTGTAVSQLAAITADRVLVSNTNGLPVHSSVSTTTLGYLDATSSIQTQLDAKQATITGGASTIVSSDLTASRVLVSNGSGKVAVSSVTSTELGYLSGVTSAIQTQLDAKIPSSYLDVDTSLTANSDSKIATQKAVKAYVDSAVTGLLDLKGSTDCLSNPNYPSALKGDAYYVTVAGKIGGASGKTVEVGDVYVALADNAGGSEASVGTSWFVLNQNLSGVALLSGTLAQFAATTSSQLAGVISDETGSGSLVFANSPTLVSPILGTPTSGTLTNCGGLPISGLVASTSAAIGVGTIELGHASDTTIARSAAGAVTIEGVLVVTETNTATMSNKTLTTPVINGATLNGDLQTDATPNTDDTWNGKSTNTFNAAGTIAQFDCVYLTSSSTWALTDADAIGTAGNVLIMMAGASGTVSNPLRVIEPGSWVRNDAWNWTVGGVLYLDTAVAGGLTQTAPSGEDDAVKIIGYAATADVIYFDPSVNWIIAKA